MPLALAGLLAACGKGAFKGETTTKIRKVPKSQPDGSGGESGAQAGQGDSDSGADTSGNYGDYGAGSGTEDGATAGADTVLPSCEPAGLGMIDFSEIPVDPTLLAPSISEGIKIWGRQSSALIALSLRKTIEQGSTIIISVPSVDNPNLGRVLAARHITNAEVDVSAPTSLVVFDNINLGGVAKLSLVLVPPSGTPVRIDITNKTTEFHPQSKRFATRYNNKPVVDIQLGFLPDIEGLGTALGKFSEGIHSPIFGGEANGFGFNRDTTSAFRAINIRTAGYINDTTGAETAHVAHAMTSWKFPGKLKSSGTIVTDLLERNISSKFSASTTTALREDYTFVVYVPDNPTAPTVYFRTIISLG
jgi:hypothetical protein